MLTFKGYKGSVFEADYGWSISDVNGRTGKLQSVQSDFDGKEQTVTVVTNYQATIQLRESEISFVHPPELED